MDFEEKYAVLVKNLEICDENFDLCDRYFDILRHDLDKIKKEIKGLKRKNFILSCALLVAFLKISKKVEVKIERKKVENE